MRLLLDTHVLLWLLDSPDRVSATTRSAIEEPANQLNISCVTAYELANKFHIGKLPIAEPILANYDGFLLRLRAQELPMTSRHGFLAGSLPGPHRDPFDRIIAAQSILEGLTLVSADPAFDSFGIQRYW